MSEPRISTSEQLASYLKNTVSEKRYVHSLGVAQTAREVLDHFSCTDYTASWHGFDAPQFCGLVHDIAREMTDAQLLDYCRKNNVFLSKEDIESPVLAHGTVSAELARNPGTRPFACTPPATPEWTTLPLLCSSPTTSSRQERS